MDQHAAGVVACAVGSALAGWAGQHFFKANPSFSTNIAHAAQFAVAFALYALGSPFSTSDPTAWLMGGFTWATAAIGIGSVMAGAGLAAKTDSR